MLTAIEFGLLHQAVNRLEVQSPFECNLLRRLIASGETMQKLGNWLRSGNSISVVPAGPIELSGTPVALVVTQFDVEGDRDSERMIAMRLNVADVHSVPELVAAELIKLK
jgi:hypothetical protein